MNSSVEQLEAWAEEAQAMLARFTRDGSGLHVGQGDQARFTGVVLEARELLGEALGHANSFGLQLERTRFEGISNYLGSQSYHSIEIAGGILRSAAKAVSRKTTTQPRQQDAHRAYYVDPNRLLELRVLRSGEWDCRRLIRMCEELNEAYGSESYHATAMLIRAITDHVPPIFGARSFAEYASSIAAKSHKSSLERLSQSLRDIANGALHVQIRQREALPTAAQVDYRPEMDVLLAEVIRKLG